MVNINYKREIPLWVMLVIPFIYCFMIWGQLPQRVPTHFGLSGQPDGWMGRPAIFLGPALGIFTYVLLLVVPLIDPKRKNYEAFGNTFYKIRLLLGVFMFVLAVIIVNAGLTGKIALGMRLFTCLLFLLFAFLGNLMINIKPNWFIGIRTPWTLSSETVWRKTHLVGGRLFFYGSLICILLTFLIPEELVQFLILGFTLSIALFLAVYSYLLFRKEQKELANNGNAQNKSQ